MRSADEIRRHNYRIARAGLKGKPKAERLRTYAAFRLGPIGPLLMISETLKQQVRPFGEAQSALKTARDEFFNTK